MNRVKFRPCLKIRSRRREEAESSSKSHDSPPPHVGGCSARPVFRHALRHFFTQSWLMLPLLLFSYRSPAAPPLPSLELRLAFTALTFSRPLWMEVALDV